MRYIRDVVRRPILINNWLLRNLGGFLEVEQGCLYSLVDRFAVLKMKIGVDGLEQWLDEGFVYFEFFRDR